MVWKALRASCCAGEGYRGVEFIPVREQLEWTQLCFYEEIPVTPGQWKVKSSLGCLWGLWITLSPRGWRIYYNHFQGKWDSQIPERHNTVYILNGCCKISGAASSVSHMGGCDSYGRCEQVSKGVKNSMHLAHRTFPPRVFEEHILSRLRWPKSRDQCGWGSGKARWEIQCRYIFTHIK